jgi:KDO2-lipid IV(A) lauroyltransferase
MWQAWGFRAAIWLAARVPRGLAYRACALGGELYFWLNPGHSHKAVENYAVLLADDVGSARVRQMARQSFRNYAKSLFDFFRQMSIDPDLIEADTFTTGWEHVEAGLARGRGIVLVTPHFGNWDLAAGLTAARGYPMVALADRFTPPEVDRLVHWSRNRTGLGIVTLDSGSLRRTIQLLRRNVIVAFLADRPQREGGVEVCFFGAPAWFPTGPARFALRTGATILLGYVGRRPGDRTFYGNFEPIDSVDLTGDEATDIRAQTQVIVQAMEGLLRQYPDQWYMFRQMWPDARTEGGRRKAKDAASSA